MSKTRKSLECQKLVETSIQSSTPRVGDDKNRIIINPFYPLTNFSEGEEVLILSSKAPRVPSTYLNTLKSIPTGH